MRSVLDVTMLRSEGRLMQSPEISARRHPLKGWLIGGSILVFFVVAALVVRRNRPGEPVYQGKTLTYWMRQIDTGSAKDQVTAQQAIKSIGRAGAPILAAYVNKKPAVWRRALRRVSNHLPSSFQGKASSWWSNSETWQDSWRSAKALSMLGEEAEAALPELDRSLNQTPPVSHYYAIEAVASLGFKGIPVLRRALSNPNPDQTTLLNVCSALGKMGPKATGAGPELAALLPNGTDPVGSAASYALGRIGGGVLPYVVPHLASTSMPTRLAALAALGFMERDATNAVPEILKLAEDPAPEVRAAVMDAVGRIQPRRPEVIEAFGHGLQDPSRKVRLTTLQIMVNSPRGVRAHLDKIESLLSDTDTNIVRAACRAVSQGGTWSKPLEPTLRKLSETSDSITRKEALNTLENIGVKN